MSDVVLEVKNLTKVYRGEGKPFTAVDGISFSLKKGEILGLLGPNGAGKTTTIQMLLGLTDNDSGYIKYFGKDFRQNRESTLSKINFASAYAEMQGKITVEQNLRIFAGLYEIENPKERIDELLETLGIEKLRNTTFWKLSSGQKTRAIVARSLLNKPKLLLMDEPTASLDPEIVNKIIDLIRELRDKEEVSILFTSHNMEEVTRLCDRVMFLHSGQIVVIDTPLGLTKMISDSKLNLIFDGTQKEVSEYLDKEAYKHRFIKKQMVEVELPEDKIPSVLFGFRKMEIFISHIEIIKPTLEDVFLTMAKKGRDELE